MTKCSLAAVLMYSGGAAAFLGTYALATTLTIPISWESRGAVEVIASESTCQADQFNDVTHAASREVLDAHQLRIWKDRVVAVMIVVTGVGGAVIGRWLARLECVTCRER